MAYYHRKSPRIPGFDYSSANYYFITICTYNRRCLFGNPNALNGFGKIAEDQLRDIPSHYEGITIDKYVVMPNHVHMILIVDEKATIAADQVIAQYKSGVSRSIRKISELTNVWQRSFHDHVIRNQASYEKIWMYIEGNPMKWCDDCFYVDERYGNR